MNEISLAGRQPVDSYGPGGFRIDGAWHGGSLVLSPGGLHGFEAPIDMEALGPLIAQAAEIDVVLIGQGAEIAPLAAPLRTALEQAGVGVEIMSVHHIGLPYLQRSAGRGPPGRGGAGRHLSRRLN
jgi:uncharacterized protein